MLHWDMFQVWYLPRPRWTRAPPWEGSTGSYRAERSTWIIFLTTDKWGGRPGLMRGGWLGLSRVNLLAMGRLLITGHVIMISGLTMPRLGSSIRNHPGNTWYRGVGWTWLKLASCLLSVVSYVEASNTWGPQGCTCQISYHKSKLSLFWINGAHIKMKKETQGSMPFWNVLKLVLRNFTFCRRNSVSQVFKEYWPHLRSQ